MYRPDNWVVIKIKGKDPHYRVLAGWTNGYLDGDSWRPDGDSWRLNSGITKVQKDFNRLFFHGSSGSTYMCLEGHYGLRMNNAHVWDDLSNRYGDMVEMLPEDTDWNNVNWSI